MEKRWSTPGILKVSGLNPRPFEFNIRPNKNNMQDLYKFHVVNPSLFNVMAQSLHTLIMLARIRAKDSFRR